MLRITAGLRVPLSFAHARCYSEGGFEIADYLSRIEAITKSRKPSQSRSPTTQGKKPSGPSQQRGPKQNHRQRGQRTSVKSGQESNTADTPRASRMEGKPVTQNHRRPRTQAPNHSAPRNPQQQQTKAVQSGSVHYARTSIGTSVEGFTPLSSISQEPLPKGGRRAATASRAPRTRSKGARKPRTTQRSSEAALMARRSLQVTEQDTSFLAPKEGLEILMRNENSTVNGFVSVDDVSLQALQANMVSSAVSYNSRVRALLRDLPESIVSDRELLKTLVRKHIQGSYDDGVVLEATNGSVSAESLVKVLNANPTLTGETKHFLASIASGKVPIKQIARPI